MCSARAQACTHLHTHTPFFTGTCPESAQGSVTQHPDPPESFLTIVMALYVRFGAWLISQRAFKPQWLQSMNKNSCPSFQQKLTCSASYMRVSVPWASVVSGDRLPVSPWNRTGALDTAGGFRADEWLWPRGTADLGSPHVYESQRASCGFIYSLYYFIIFCFAYPLFDIYHLLYSTYFGFNMLFLLFQFLQVETEIFKWRTFFFDCDKMYLTKITILII